MSDSPRVRGATEPPSDGTDTDPAFGRFDPLSDRLRDVLSCLRLAKTPMALADLTDDVVRREANASPTATPEKRERVYASLYRNHLPKLREAGLVSFDTERKLVNLRADEDDLPPTDRPNRVHPQRADGDDGSDPGQRDIEP